MRGLSPRASSSRSRRPPRASLGLPRAGRLIVVAGGGWAVGDLGGATEAALGARPRRHGARALRAAPMRARAGPTGSRASRGSPAGLHRPDARPARGRRRADRLDGGLTVFEALAARLPRHLLRLGRGAHPSQQRGLRALRPRAGRGRPPGAGAALADALAAPGIPDRSVRRAPERRRGDPRACGDAGARAGSGVRRAAGAAGSAAGAAWSFPALAPIVPPSPARCACPAASPARRRGADLRRRPAPAGHAGGSSGPRVRAQATFFLVGEQVERHPAPCGRDAAGGHAVAIHGHRHRDLLRLTPWAFAHDLDRGVAVIADATGLAPTLYRPPSGSTPPRAGPRAPPWPAPVAVVTWGRDWRAATRRTIADACRGT